MTARYTIPEAVMLNEHSVLFRIVRHMVSFLKWRFSLLPQGSYRWDPDSERSAEQSGSEIFISADTPLRPEVPGMRPAITVLRSHAAFQGVGLGDMAYVDLATGAQSRMDLVPTTLVINVLSRLPVEAENVAWFISNQIFTLREEIIRTEPTLLYMGSRANISAPSPAGSLVQGSTDVEWCVVALSYPTFLQYSTGKLPLNKQIVNGFEFTTRTLEPTSPVSTNAKVTVPLQGSAVNQPKQNDADRAAAVPDLPQQGSDKAQST